MREVSPTSPKHRGVERQVDSTNIKKTAESQIKVVRKRVDDDAAKVFAKFTKLNDNPRSMGRPLPRRRARLRASVSKRPLVVLIEPKEFSAKLEQKAIPELRAANRKMFPEDPPNSARNSTPPVSPVVRYLAERVVKTYDDKYRAGE